MPALPGLARLLWVTPCLACLHLLTACQTLPEQSAPPSRAEQPPAKTTAQARQTGAPRKKPVPAAVAPAPEPAPVPAPEPEPQPEPEPAPAPSVAEPVQSDEPDEFAAQVSTYAQDLARQHGWPQSTVLALLQEARRNATVARLIAATGPKRKVLRAWPLYRQRFVERIRIRDGVAFLRDHAVPLARAQARYGVPASVIAAIIGVETLYGRDTGNFRVLDTLTTLALDYPEPERSERVQLFREQLADLIALHLAGQLDARSLRGSFAGAIGMPQFMPGSLKRYAVDGDGDGRIDLHRNVADVAMSVGHFLQAHGWLAGLPVFAPVTLPESPAALVAGGLAPTLDWPRLQAAGARLNPEHPAYARSDTRWQRSALGVINLVDERVAHTEYRVATANFFALTHYNRSYFYASAVADLAAVLQRRIDDDALP